jgi:hypothetical protein
MGEFIQGYKLWESRQKQTVVAVVMRPGTAEATLKILEKFQKGCRIPREQCGTCALTDALREGVEADEPPHDTWAEREINRG